MGTSDFAVPSLLGLFQDGHRIVGVVSQPDRARGRGKKVRPTPVKEMAVEMGLAIFQSNNIKSDEALEQIRQWDPEIIVVASYGQIIPPAILDYPPHGCINVHASLLPRHRGAAPVQRAIMAGDEGSGVTIMYMEKGLDTGDIIAQKAVDIGEEMDSGLLERILAQMGAELLLQVIKEMESGPPQRRKQDDALATYAHMLSKEDELIDWNRSAGDILNQVRAMSPVPGAYTLLDGGKVKIFSVRVIPEILAGEIGQVVSVTDESFLVKTGNGMLEILEIQKEGKNRIKAGDFLRGYRQLEGRVLGK